MECAASLDVLKLRNLITADCYERGLRPPARLRVLEPALTRMHDLPHDQPSERRIVRAVHDAHATRPSTPLIT
jgi:hypothetical protein